MKKKILMIAGSLAVMALVLVNVNEAFNMDVSSDMSLLSVNKALADDEFSSTNIYKVAPFRAHCTGSTTIKTTKYYDVNGHLVGSMKLAGFGTIEGGVAGSYSYKTESITNGNYDFWGDGNTCPATSSVSCVPTNPCSFPAI
jgi:hypothetical protein